MANHDVSLKDPMFFIPQKNSIDTSKPFSLPINEDWNENRKQEWTYLFPIVSQVPRQGWKIHISSGLHNSEKVLLKVQKVCIQFNVPFKHLSSRQAFINRNSKLIDRGFSGKFITCYPEENILEELLDSLENQLKDETGPYILSDRRWRKGPIFLRYGVFRESLPYEDKQIPINMLEINGALVEDMRQPTFTIPKELEIPSFLQDWLDESGEEESSVKSIPFEIIKAIKFSNSGGIYRGKLSKNDLEVIIREARAYSGIDMDGIYAIERLKAEENALNKLLELKEVPACFWSGEIWENMYLVEQKS